MKPRIMELRQERTDWPRCEAMLSLVTRQFWFGRGRPSNEVGSDYCQNNARYRINGRFFCRKHGALYLLDYMLGKTGE